MNFRDFNLIPIEEHPNYESIKDKPEMQGIRVFWAPKPLTSVISVQPEWHRQLTLQQQSVLMLAARGPDGIAKDHPCKDVQRAYRGCVLMAARYGRMLRWGEKADSFMSLDRFADIMAWATIVHSFFETIDDLPHHFIMHLLHGAEIMGYKHPEVLFRARWLSFYNKGCYDMHMNPETQKQMDNRLSDWSRKHWNSEILSHATT